MSEKTPLIRNDSSVPSYVFLSNRDRQYRKRVRRLQWVICALVLCIPLAYIILMLSFSGNGDGDNNSTDVTTTTISPAPTVQSADVPTLKLTMTADLANNQLPDSDELPNLLQLDWPLKDKTWPMWSEPLNASDVASAISCGREKLREKDLLEEELPGLPVDSPAFRHRLATYTGAEATRRARAGFVMEGATINLLQNRTYDKTRLGRSPPFWFDWLPGHTCDDDVGAEPEAPPCLAERFRSYDGSCNNLAHGRTWGVGMRPFRRHLPPDYADGVQSPRKSGDGSYLPSARLVSLTVHRPSYKEDPKFTVMLAVWGQFVDHDITATAINDGKTSISCCDRNVMAGSKRHPECYTVTIFPPDPFYLKFNITCLEFVRSSPAPMCSFGPREQMTQTSSYIDGSLIYGASEAAVRTLRTFRGGEMKTLMAPGGIELLPISTDSSDGCNQEKELSKGRYCFLTGDGRSNENTHITTLHLIMVREHNRIVRQLAAMNGGWDDERLFQETRRIVGAQMQHIHYNEFLPVVLGRRIMRHLRMMPRARGYSHLYDPNVDASIANEFSASAYRFGHTLLPGLFRLLDKEKSEEYIQMHKMLFNPFPMYDKDFIEKAVRGAMNTAIERADNSFNTEFTQHLFERKVNQDAFLGLDLVSMNVQRGRDHGLPGYPKFRKLCGLSEPRDFEDLKAYIDDASVYRLKELYKTVDDIDFYTGSVSEGPMEDSLVGPTIVCLITDQFLRLQRGDRFWYETSEAPQAFTPDQLHNIKKASLAKILCENSGVDEAQTRVMERQSPTNMVQKCSDLPAMDLSAWKENDKGEFQKSLQ